MYRTLLPDGAKPRNPIPDWGGDPQKLVVGVEEERFILNNDGSAPTIEQIQRLFESLIDLGFQARQVDEKDRPLSLGKEFDEGYLSIKMDAYTHIIELALPPLSDPDRIAEILSGAWMSVTECSQKHDLDLINSNSFLPLPAGATFVPNFVRANWMKSRQKPSPEELAGYDPVTFLGTMTSTQIHLNCCEEIYEKLGKLYEFEYLFSILFRNQKTIPPYFDNRNSTWLSVFPKNYKAVGMPSEIPASKDQYQDLISATVDFKKDYSFIAPRPTGSVEFRTADSQPGTESTLELIAFRMGALLAALRYPLRLRPEIIKKSLLKTYHDGSYDSQLMSVHADELFSVYESIPERWRPHFKTALRRFHGVLGVVPQQSARSHLG